MKTVQRFERTLEITAKILSAVSLGFVLIFAIGNFFGPHQCLPNFYEFLQFLLFPVGVITGLFVSWKYTLIGSVISIGSLFSFYVAEYLIQSVILKGPFFILLCLPAFIFLFLHILKSIKK
jgi:hypothetical protein